MNKWADYLISKEKWGLNNKTIESFFVHEDLGETVSDGIERNRSWIVQMLQNGKTFCCVQIDESGKWVKGGNLKLLYTGALDWSDKLPLIQTKRKTFISYYHKDDQNYKEKFINLTSDLIINKSVNDGDINSDVSDEYIKQLIQKGFLSDTTVLVVLIGSKTKCRKHVDWEISGALNLKVGNHYAGLLGLLLPSHPDFGKTTCQFSEIPKRLADNLESDYAVIIDYTNNRVDIQKYIELAYNARNSKVDKRINSRPQMKIDLCS